MVLMIFIARRIESEQPAWPLAKDEKMLTWKFG